MSVKIPRSSATHLLLKSGATLLWALITVLICPVPVAAQLVLAPYSTTLYQFYNSANGYDPTLQGIVAGPAGTIFGVSTNGGTGADGPSCNTIGCGFIYQLSPSGASTGGWSETPIYQFTGASDGCAPGGQLAVDSSGALYGVTNGASLCSAPGTVFKLTPPRFAGGAWAFQTIYSAPIYDFVNPSLVIGQNGVIYGTEVYGNLFRLTPPATAGDKWRYQVLASVAGYPSGGLVTTAGALFGSTQIGGAGYGTVFEAQLLPSGRWTVSTIVTFTGGADGGVIAGFNGVGLAVFGNGVLLGISSNQTPGCNPTCGTIFELSQSSGVWARTAIHTFSSNQFISAGSLVTAVDGRVAYGNIDGGGVNGFGVVFKLSAPSITGGTWQYTEFDLTQSGVPEGNLIPDPAGTGVYLTTALVSSVIDVSFPISSPGAGTGSGVLVPPFKSAAAGSCISTSTNPTASTVTFSNSCSFAVSFWGCWGAVILPLDPSFCSPAIYPADYVQGVLRQSASVTYDTYSSYFGLEPFGTALECPKAWYTIPIYDGLGDEYLDCGREGP